jgi:hypothetical protein
MSELNPMLARAIPETPGTIFYHLTCRSFGFAVFAGYGLRRPAVGSPTTALARGSTLSPDGPSVRELALQALSSVEGGLLTQPVGCHSLATVRLLLTGGRHGFP